MSMKIKQKFLIPLLTLIIVSVFVMGTISFLEQSKDFRKLFINSMLQSETLIIKASNIWFVDRDREITNLAESNIVQKAIGTNFISKASRDVVSKQMKEMSKTSNMYNWLYMVDKDQNILASSNDNKQLKAPNLVNEIINLGWEYIKTHKKIYHATFRKDGTIHYTVIAPITKEDKALSSTSFEGAIVAEVNVNLLTTTLLQNIKIGETGRAHIYNLDGYNVNKDAHDTISTHLHLLERHGKHSFNGNPEHDNDHLYFIYGDKIHTAHIMEHYPWIIGVSLDKSELTDPAYMVALKILFIGIIISILTGIIISILIKWIIRPIQNLADTARQVSTYKDYSVRAEKFSDDELGTLVNTFNDMLHQIGMREKALKKAKDNIEKTAQNLEKANRIAKTKWQEAEMANNAKSDFLAKMSHELRTTINSIIGLSEILLHENLNPKHTKLVSVVRKSSSILLEVVNDILDISKIEEGVLNLENIVFDFGATVLDIVETLSPLAQEKNIEIKCNAEKDQIFVLGDPIRVKRVFINLISNAIKYTEEGSIKISVSSNHISKTHIEVKCDISDTGIGIAPERLDSIFEKFIQADDSISRKFGGTGLGLSITKQLVELMEGKIWVISTKSQGSTFSFKIPFKKSNALRMETISKAKKQPTEKSPTKKKELKNKESKTFSSEARILIAEDNELNIAFIKTLLKRIGIIHMDVAYNGTETIDAFKEHNYDIIFMDCHMPELDGYQATEEIRELEKEQDRDFNIPIVAMTADAMPGTAEACIDSGMNDYLFKPIDINKTSSILSQWISFEDQPHISKKTIADIPDEDDITEEEKEQ